MLIEPLLPEHHIGFESKISSHTLHKALDLIGK